MYLRPWKDEFGRTLDRDQPYPRRQVKILQWEMALAVVVMVAALVWMLTPWRPEWWVFGAVEALSLWFYLSSWESKRVMQRSYEFDERLRQRRIAQGIPLDSPLDKDTWPRLDLSCDDAGAQRTVR